MRIETTSCKCNFDPGNHQAKHGDGILTFKLIKRKELAPRKIDILSN
ncbi:MAG: hypothetical protein ACKVLL_03760 [Verrucomicrobiales bacterium]